MSKCIKGGVLGAIILFIWSFVSWMVLPWHENSIHTFKDETAISQIIQSNASVSGIYFSPSYKAADANTPPPQGPTVFAAVHLEGAQGSMTMPMVISFLTYLVAAFLVAWMLSKMNGSSYFQRVMFVVVFALAAGVVTDVPYWNWFKFDMNYTLIMMADLLVGWFLAGLVMAKVCKK